MKQYFEERIAYLKNIEREKMNDIDNVPLGPLRTTQWDLIKEIGARKNELQNALRFWENAQLQQPVVMQAEGSDGAKGAAVASSAVGSQTSARVEMCGSDCCPDDGQCENCQNPIRTGG